MDIKMKFVKSSNISAIGYDLRASVLRVRFSSGSTYDYSGVTNDDWLKFAAAESKGAHFAAHIRGKYQGVKL